MGSSGTIEEINNKVPELAGLSDEQLEVLHNPEKGGQTEVEYRLAWTRTYLKKYSFNLSFMRHTGQWVEVYTDCALDECLSAIREDAFFQP